MILKILSTGAIVLFVAVAGLLFISSVSIPGVMLDARVVLTGSMEPAIPTGSVVFTLPRSTYAEGDIVTFKRAESTLETPITHRIMRVEVFEGSTFYTTQGDANEHPDSEPVRESEVLGRVLFHIPFIGRLLELARTPWGFALLIIVPAILVIADEVRKILREVKKPDEQETTNTPSQT